MDRPSFDGLLILDKPGGLTSRAVVDRAQHWFPRRTRVGHTGTLDPLATGVLVLCVGVATRLTEYVQRMDKTYRAGLLLGQRSDTHDADGNVLPVPVDHPPDRAGVAACLRGFVGDIEQVPPAYSAAKVSGSRAYDLARKGRDVALAARRVVIHRIDLIAYAYPRLELEVRCGKGTYIRALARDLGEALGCGALVQTLRRTRVGPFSPEDAVRLDAEAAAARSRLLPLAAAVSELPRVTLAAADAARLRQGQGIHWAVPLEGESAVFDEAGRLVAIAVPDHSRQVLRPVKVLPPGV
jgi:tRNA pseudouridine55 synthase